MSENELSKLVVDLCFKIHKQYGPGLFEIVYEEIFCHEWEKNKIPFTRQHPIPLIRASFFYHYQPLAKQPLHGQGIGEGLL